MSQTLKTTLKAKKAGVVLAQPEQSIESCLDAMAKANIGSVLIVKDGKIEGIFTERDLLRHWRQLADATFKTRPVASVMSTPVFSMKISELATAPQEMLERRIRHVPLTDETGSVAGIISMRDVLQAQLRAKSLPKLRLAVKNPEAAPTESAQSASSTLGLKNVLHILTPYPQLVEICRQGLPNTWRLNVWTDINALQNAPEIKEEARREHAAFVIDLDGYIHQDWKKLIRRFIEFLRTAKQPEVFLVWSPQLIAEADVASLQAVAVKAKWRAYHRPLPVAEFTMDLREISDGVDEEEED